MTDIVDKATRSRMMSGIRSRNTRPELALRSALHFYGLRFRVNRKDLPGSPDIVFAGARAAIFVHGCFWHRHQGCNLSSSPHTRPDFWNAKFAQNVARDRRSLERLMGEGWRVAIIWECALKKAGEPSIVASKIRDWLAGGGSFLEVGSAN